MRPTKRFLFLFFTCISAIGYTQKTSIEFESNGRSQKETEQNVFQKFIGEWTLKNDDWTHNWGNGTETIKIPNHHTVTQEINTNNSLLSIIDGPAPNGHIFWSYNPNTKEVYHLSSFGTLRAGNGMGTINENGDVQLKASFEGEPKGTYRLYHYKWIHDDEYHMKSVQYDQNNQPTGLFYEGYFIRIDSPSNSNLKKEISAILKVLDNNQISIDQQLEVYSDTIIHMAPNAAVISNKESLKDYLTEQRNYGTAKMKHQIISIESLGDKALMRGAVTGTFYPKNGEPPIAFKTKNIFVFGRVNGVLKIEKIIYNNTPV